MFSVSHFQEDASVAYYESGFCFVHVHSTYNLPPKTGVKCVKVLCKRYNSSKCKMCLDFVQKYS